MTTIATLQKRLKEVSALASNGALVGRLSALPRATVARYIEWRQLQRQWYADHPDAYSDMINHGIEPPVMPRDLAAALDMECDGPIARDDDVVATYERQFGRQ